ncbi:adhesion G-protein coupled receptor G5 [Notolabrus celidotus]|uniref:adhesion G-protein coupled receptor G5 n=1 Tax=Notolabrus celidotus TaxID=1203425 RepID=UPI00148F5136|nr:adhesion G-protein coupled receptor G5 [Notolabrus celidotus]
MMVPFLLLLLLSGLMANELCFQISDGIISMSSTECNVTDNRKVYSPCIFSGYNCMPQCTVQSPQKRMFNGSLTCFDIETTFDDRMVEHTTQGITCKCHICHPIPVMKLLNDLSRNDSLQTEIMKLYHIIHSCDKLFAINDYLMRNFIKVEKNIIHNIMENTQLEAGGNKTYNMEDLSLNVININEAILNLMGKNSTIQVEAPQLWTENESFIPDVWLPVDALRDLPQETRTIGLVSYKSPILFQSPHQFQQEQISSMILRIELLGDQQFQNLPTSVMMIFRTFLELKNLDNDTWLECRFFDEQDWVWKNDGCETDTETFHPLGFGGKTGHILDRSPTNYSETFNDQITCRCNHTTPFAVLLIRDPIAQIHWEILSYISYIGCGLSAFFTALSLVIYVFSRNQKTDYSISIHVSLSGALFLLNTTFLLTEWGATVKLDWVCVFVAALMHYSLLCCFTWMAIEALHLYLLLIKVFNTDYKHYLVKLSLAGWGIPAVIVAVSVGMKDFKQFYGVTHMTMADTNQTNSICWITDDSFFYSLNLVYFTLIFIFNTGILVAVGSSICKMKQMLRSRSKLGAKAEVRKSLRDPQRFTESCKGGLTVLSLTCLMGTTWGLAFLGSGYINYPILYLFCILNSTQGFFIFLWICLSAKKQRKREMEEKLSSTPVRTLATKSE